MNVLRPLEEADSVFMIFTKKLTATKFHELLNKVQEFVSTLKEEDLVDNNLKELVVKRDPVGGSKQSVLLSYYQSQPTTSTTEIDSPLQKATAVGSQSHIQSLHEELENLSKKVKLGEEHFARKSLQNTLPQTYDINANFPLNKPAPPFAPEFEAYENAKEDFRSPSNSTYQSSLSPQSMLHNPFNQVSTTEFAVLENSPTDKYVQDTPKFPNENGLSAYVNKVWEEKGNFDREYTKSHKTHPSFDSSFINVEPADFDLNSVKPGMVSSKLAEALGMNSERDAPPYLANLSKVELPSYYRGETFYGINTPVPQNYNLESWEKAGVKPHLIGGGPRGYKEVHTIDEEISRNRSNEDEQYLNKMLRKPQNYYIQNNIYYKVTGIGADQKPIEID